MGVLGDTRGGGFVPPGGGRPVGSARGIGMFVPASRIVRSVGLRGHFSRGRPLLEAHASFTRARWGASREMRPEEGGE